MIATTIDRAVSYLYYADRVYQLPLGVIGVAIGVVLLPDMSRRLRADDEAGGARAEPRARTCAVPDRAGDGRTRSSSPCRSSTRFRAWRLHRADAIATAHALAAFRLGLPAFCMNKVFSPGFFAREDTKTPMMFAMISVAVNVAVSLMLSRYIGHVGIALATASPPGSMPCCWA